MNPLNVLSLVSQKITETHSTINATISGITDSEKKKAADKIILLFEQVCAEGSFLEKEETLDFQAEDFDLCTDSSLFDGEEVYDPESENDRRTFEESFTFHTMKKIVELHNSGQSFSATQRLYPKLKYKTQLRRIKAYVERRDTTSLRSHPEGPPSEALRRAAIPGSSKEKPWSS